MLKSEDKLYPGIKTNKFVYPALGLYYLCVNKYS